jgi:hypothetical protein
LKPNGAIETNGCFFSTRSKGVATTNAGRGRRFRPTLTISSSVANERASKQQQQQQQRRRHAITYVRGALLELETPALRLMDPRPIDGCEKSKWALSRLKT